MISQKSVVSEVTPHLVKFSGLLMSHFFDIQILWIVNVYRIHSKSQQDRICTIHITFSTNWWPHFSAFPPHQFQQTNLPRENPSDRQPRYKQERMVNPNQRPKRKILRITYLEGFERNSGLKKFTEN